MKKKKKKNFKRNFLSESFEVGGDSKTEIDVLKENENDEVEFRPESPGLGSEDSSDSQEEIELVIQRISSRVSASQEIDQNGVKEEPTAQQDMLEC